MRLTTLPLLLGTLLLRRPALAAVAGIYRQQEKYCQIKGCEVNRGG